MRPPWGKIQPAPGGGSLVSGLRRCKVGHGGFPHWSSDVSLNPGDIKDILAKHARSKPAAEKAGDEKPSSFLIGAGMYLTGPYEAEGFDFAR